MRKILTATAAASALVVATVAAPQHAEARYGRNAAIIGGIALGVLAGAAIANGGYYYYGPPRRYYYDPPRRVYYGRHCYWSRHRVWNGYRWHRVRVCR
jgi:hypothetical protein